MIDDKKIWISADKFKEILIYSWHLLPENKQFELMKIGLNPNVTHPR